VVIIIYWIQKYKSHKLKKEQGVRVFIYFKKSKVKLGKKNTTLIEYVLPSGVFYVFASGEHYKTLKKSPNSIFTILQEINGIDSQVNNLIREDGKLSLNGSLITIQKEIPL
jgi:hypothetical protein